MRKSVRPEMDSLFGEEVPPEIEELTSEKHELSLKEKLDMEFEILGGYVTSNPLDYFPEYTSKCVNLERTKLAPGTYDLVGVAEDVKTFFTKKGDMMARFRLSYYSASLQCVMFPRAFKEFGGALSGDAVFIRGARVEDRDGNLQCIVENVKKLCLE